MKRPLLELADEVRAIAITGLHFAEGHFDLERYAKLLDVAVRLATLAADRCEDDVRAIYLSSDEGYVTPKLDVRMAVFEEDRVLLVQERADACWALPGGYVDIGDSPAGAAEREAWEEACVEVRAQRLAGVFDYRLHPQAPPIFFQIHKLVFIGERIGAPRPPTPGPEVSAAGFFRIGDLPPLSEARTLPIHIETAYKALLDPGRPTHFE